MSNDLPSTIHGYCATGLSLREATLYYTSVVARGSSGLLAWDVSDGFSLDSQTPDCGIVSDGDGESCVCQQLSLLLSFI